MPLPLILIGIGVATSLLGGKKTVDAVKTTSKTRKLDEEARSVFSLAESRLKSARSGTSYNLDELGKLKLNIWSEQLGRFTNLLERIRDIEMNGKAEVDQLSEIIEQLTELKGISLKATEVLAGGLTGLGAGALAGVASYGGAIMFASASTGTAISTLSGVAATNATMAWFGGGALSAGGLGMAGGVYVLGGLIAGPVLAVGGMVFSAKAKGKLATAKSNLAEARKAAQEMKNAAAIVDGIKKIAIEIRSTINRLKSRVDTILDDLENILNDHSGPEGYVSYTEFSFEEKQKVYLTVKAVQVMKILLETPLLTKDGALEKNYYKALEKGNEFLNA